MQEVAAHSLLPDLSAEARARTAYMAHASVSLLPEPFFFLLIYSVGCAVAWEYRRVDSWLDLFYFSPLAGRQQPDCFSMGAIALVFGKAGTVDNGGRYLGGTIIHLYFWAFTIRGCKCAGTTASV